LASLLGDRGHRVPVLDRATFPSDTLSTHVFRSPAICAFSEIDAYKEVQAVAPHLAVNYNLIDGNVIPEPVDRPEDSYFRGIEPNEGSALPWQSVALAIRLNYPLRMAMRCNPLFP
jgi:hypothetical protein